jgi:hypothetical protein
MSKVSLWTSQEGNTAISINDNMIEDLVKKMLYEKIKRPIELRIQYYSESLTDEHIDGIIKEKIPTVIENAVSHKLNNLLGVQKNSYGEYDIKDGGTLAGIVNSIINEVAEQRITEFVNVRKEEIKEIAKKTLSNRKRIAEIHRYKIEDAVNKRLEASVQKITDQMLKGQE